MSAPSARVCAGGHWNEQLLYTAQAMSGIAQRPIGLEGLSVPLRLQGDLWQALRQHKRRRLFLPLLEDV